MIIDKMKNRKDFKVTNISFSKEQCKTIVLIPYNYSLSPEKDIVKDIVNEYCSKELEKHSFAIIKIESTQEYIKKNEINILTKVNALDMDKLKSNHTIQKIGKGMNADAVMAVDVKTLYQGHWFGGNVTELEVFLFNSSSEKLMWKGYANMIHSPAGKYNVKAFSAIFKRLFADLK